MFRHIRKAVFAGNKPLVIRYAGDVRYTRAQMASSHDQEQMRALTTDNLNNEDIRQAANKADIIGIDEGQFMDNLVEFCVDMANSGKQVIVAGLDSDFLQRPFPRIAELIPKSEYVTKLHAVCVCCQGVASFSRRLSDSKDLEVIGGADEYVSTCRQCFDKPIEPSVLEKHKAAIDLVRELRQSPQ